MHSLLKRRLWRGLRTAFQYLKGTYRKAGEGLFTQACNVRTKGNGFKQRVGLDWILGRNLQRGCGLPIPGDVKSQTGWGFE